MWGIYITSWHWERSPVPRYWHLFTLKPLNYYVFQSLDMVNQTHWHVPNACLPGILRLLVSVIYIFFDFDPAGPYPFFVLFCFFWNFEKHRDDEFDETQRKWILSSLFCLNELCCHFQTYYCNREVQVRKTHIMLVHFLETLASSLLPIFSLKAKPNLDMRWGAWVVLI